MTINRRSFIQSTAFGSAAIGASLACGELINSSLQSANAADPVARNGKPKFKYSLAAYSYRKLLQGSDGKEAELTLADFIRDCADFGLDGTELTSYYFPETPSPKYLRKLKAQAFRLGLSVSGTAVRNDFGLPEGPKRKENIAHVKRWVDYAAILGAPVIRIFAGKQHKDTTEAQSHSLIVAAIEECCDYAGQHGVYLALENHGGPTATADGLLKFVRDVQSDWFGVNLDSGNFHSEDPYKELEQIAPYALNVQIKVKTSGPDKVEKPTDFGKIKKILDSSGYRGFVVLEFEEDGDVRKECRKYVDVMRKALEARSLEATTL